MAAESVVASRLMTMTLGTRTTRKFCPLSRPASIVSSQNPLLQWSSRLQSTIVDRLIASEPPQAMLYKLICGSEAAFQALRTLEPRLPESGSNQRLPVVTPTSDWATGDTRSASQVGSTTPSASTSAKTSMASLDWVTAVITAWFFKLQVLATS